MDSLPSDGPIISDWIISADAGSLPALKTFARSIASFNEKSPVISDLPPDIGPLVTPGAEYTVSSRTIAMLYEFL